MTYYVACDFEWRNFAEILMTGRFFVVAMCNVHNGSMLNGFQCAQIFTSKVHVVNGTYQLKVHQKLTPLIFFPVSHQIFLGIFLMMKKCLVESYLHWTVNDTFFLLFWKN